MKNFKKMTMLLFVAATIFSFASCNEDDDSSSSSISESNLVGEWGWPSNHVLSTSKLVINNDHTAIFKSQFYTWTLKGNTFSGKNDDGREINLKIKSMNGEKMVVEGEEKLVRNGSVVTSTDLSGTIIKTVTVSSPALTDGLMVGTWKFKDSGQSHDQYDVIINSDHTFIYQYSHSEGTWRLDGSRFIGTERGGSYDGSDLEYSFTVETMTSSSTNVVLNAVDGKYGNKTFAGTFTKNL